MTNEVHLQEYLHEHLQRAFAGIVAKCCAPLRAVVRRCASVGVVGGRCAPLCAIVRGVRRRAPLYIVVAVMNCERRWAPLCVVARRCVLIVHRCAPLCTVARRRALSCTVVRLFAPSHAVTPMSTSDKGR